MTKQNVKSIQRKYPVIERLHQNFGLNYNKALRSLITHCDISRKTFYNDMAIPFGSDKTIPKGRLMLYASFFGIEFTEIESKTESDALTTIAG
jgi:hypothetical protein